MNNYKLHASFSFLLIALMGLFLTSATQAKHRDDVVVMKNGDKLTGEIKSLRNGELRFKASYMAESVRLDWARVERLESKDEYQIFLTSGQIFSDSLKLVPSSETGSENFVIGGNHNKEVRVRQIEVVRIAPFEKKFFTQLEGSIDFGFSYTSGNDQYDTQLVATTTYRTRNNSFTARIDSLFSGQTEGSSSIRNQFGFDYRRQITPKWYAGGLFDFLRSDQQSLDHRLTVGGLVGRSLKQTETTKYSVFGGLAVTREKYSAVTGQPQKTNVDALAGLDLTRFSFNTTEISSRFMLFPSLTTPGRMRMQATSDMRIKIAKDLYWGFHIYENFDSKPPVRADRNDLGLSTSIGWKF